MRSGRRRVRRSTQQNGNLFRDEFEPPRRHVANLMWDRRIRRGLAARAAPVILSSAPSTRRPSRGRFQPPVRDFEVAFDYTYLGMKPPGFGDPDGDLEEERRETESLAIDLSEFLEEKTEPVRKLSSSTQTDAFDASAATPPYVPVKTGIDAAVQVEGDMVFDFDRDVEPIVEVMVDKTIEQSLLEVLQEESVADSTEKQREYKDVQESRASHMRTMEHDERAEVKRQRLVVDEARRRQAALNETKKKILAQTVSARVLTQVQENVMRELVQEGYFKDTVRIDVEKSFVPWLQSAVTGEVGKTKNIDFLISGACAQ